ADALARWHREVEPEPFLADLPVDERYPAEPPRRSRRLRPVAWLLGGFGTIGVAGLLITTMVHRSGDTAAPSPSASQSSTTAPSAAPLPVAGITLYDPPPGDGQENPNQVTKAADGDPTTVWPTLEYRRNAQFGNLKPGVGLIFDLSRTVRVGSV